MISDIKMAEKVLITGGAGYVGSSLVPFLLNKGYKVAVYDLYLYGDVFKSIAGNPNLVQIKADIRDEKKLIDAGRGVNKLIHLACISNDPSFELNPELGKSINYDAFFNVIKSVEKNNIERLIFASSSSIYGVKPDDLEVTEDVEPFPLTDYAKFKLECEKVLQDSSANYTTVRPATICGYAPRLRLDLTINILTINALVNKKIQIHGGSQMRSHININDMLRVYEQLLTAPDELVKGQAFNASYTNMAVEESAKLIKNTLENLLGNDEIVLEKIDTVDKRSYKINSDKIKKILKFETKYTIEDAVKSLEEAYSSGLIKDGLKNPIYHNVKLMKQINLK